MFGGVCVEAEGGGLGVVCGVFFLVGDDVGGGEDRGLIVCVI